jgi:hypothetical protein
MGAAHPRQPGGGVVDHNDVGVVVIDEVSNI